MHAGRNTSSLARVLTRHFVNNIILVGMERAFKYADEKKTINHYLTFIFECRLA